jgi:hypothetical protein
MRLLQEGLMTTSLHKI